MPDSLEFCSFRIPKNIHKKIKIKAIEEEKTLQKWLLDLIKEKLETDEKLT